MNILGWIILGILAGWIASKITGTDERMGCIANLAAGIVGAALGGLIFSLLGGAGITGFNIWSLLVAIVGAVILLFIVKAVTR